MLLKLDNQIRRAYEHAEDCAQRARIARSPQERSDWLFVEQHWLTLARTLSFAQRFERFSDETRRNRYH